MKKFSKLMLAVAIPAALLAGNAKAALITDWTYENRFGFTDWVSSAGSTTGITSTSNNPAAPQFYSAPFAGTPVPAPIPGSSLALEWGSSVNADPFPGPNPSSFSLLPASGQQTGTGLFSAPTYVSSVPGSSPIVNYRPDLSLVHDNNPVYGPTLLSVVLNGALMLQANQGANNQVGPLTAAFNIVFTETPNVAGTCVATPGAPCPDIFVIGVGSSPLENIFLATIDEYSYYLDVGITGLTGLTSAECQAAGATPAGSPPYCLGFVTQENELNRLDLAFAIRAVENPIPEPGTLALLGLGLAGLGLGRYRRRK